MTQCQTIMSTVDLRLSLVCKQCLEARSDEIKLLTKSCLEEDRSNHGKADLIHASLTWDGEIKKVRLCHPLPIREMPRVFFKGRFKFKLCVGKSRCKGEGCTYAHNKAELESWNKKLLGSLHTTLKGVPVSLEELVTSTLEATLKKLRLADGQETPPEQPSQLDNTDTFPGVDIVASQNSSKHEQLTNFKPNSRLVYQSKFQYRKVTAQDVARIKAPLRRDNYQEKFKALLKCEQEDHSTILQEKCEGDYMLVLHQAGAKKPEWMVKEARRELKRFGYLKGLSGDKIAYAAQAAQSKNGVLLVFNQRNVCKADILRENFGSTTEKMYIAFDDFNLKKLDVKDAPVELDVHVQFQLKYSYFRDLESAVNKIDGKIIKKIMPDKQNFEPFKDSTPQCPHRCSPDQSKALQAIISCPSSGPPILITGPFGTGKSYILAVSASYLFENHKHMQRPVRVLVCTQQRLSADSFLDCYLNLMIDEQVAKVYVIREYGNDWYKGELRKHYKTCEDFYGVLSRDSYHDRTSYLIITTCLTAPKLAEFLQPGFFTHVMIDEAAQMREPEAISPLALASEKTQIVLAGDHQQVGPSMLVLGDKAQENGLAMSLLERLSCLYRSMGKCAEHYMVNLVTNFRCHEEIIKFSGNLFYNSQPRLADSENLPLAHPDYPYPLYFICSSIEESTSKIDSFTNEKEAVIVIEEIKKIALSWPTHRWGPVNLPNVCIMSTSRSQLTVVNQVVEAKRLPSKLKRVSRKPTYEMQGREFRALVLSTHEPTNTDGSTRDPTKTFCDRKVFNTAITRAQSLVISVGNPFVLLAMETCAATECWSNYLMQCIKHGTFVFHATLNLEEEVKWKCLRKIDTLIKERLPEQASTATSDDSAEQCVLPTLSDIEAFQDSVSSQELFSTSSNEPWSPLTSDDSCFSVAVPNIQTEKQEIPQKKEEDPVLNKPKPTSTSGLFTKEYTIVKKLGKGGFGHVFQVCFATDKAEYAMKVIRLPSNTDKQQQKLREVQTSAKFCHHPNIVPYHHSWIENTEEFQDQKWWTELKDESQSITRSSANSDGKSSTAESNGLSLNTVLFIKTALCKEDTLRNWLEKNIDENTRLQTHVLSFFEQILGALVHIHKEKIVHRDLKPSNIFFARGKDNVIQVGDFGLATSFPTTADHEDGDQVQSYSNYPHGTQLYMSPEQMKGERCDDKTDMYAIGVVLFELWYPMKTKMERFMTLTKLREGQLPPKFCDQLPNEVPDIIQSLMQEKPVERPTASELESNEKLSKLHKRLNKRANARKCVPLL